MAIIAGPMVRQSDRKQLSLWLVSEQAVELDLKLYDKDVNGNLIASKLKFCRQLKLAERCYVYLISSEFDLEADELELIFYDLLIDGTTLQGSVLQRQICFKGQQLPSVRLPKQHRHILQASCRKPHASGPKDQLSAAAEYVEKTLHSAQRPSLLMLSGDQIYADDVSPISLDYLQRQVRNLGFTPEQLEAEGESVALDSLLLDRRHKVLKQADGFTSGAKDSHLIGFGEYFLMYLFSFNGLQAGTEFASYASLKANLYRKKKARSKFAARTLYQRKQYREDLKQLKRFAASAQSVRKLLANTVTYMMFDDHDVTDDWNLSLDNQTRLARSSTGQQVSVNALSAYMLVQHWGNQSQAEFSELAQIEALAQKPVAGKREPLLPLLSKDWGYIVPSQPPLVALDTRTGRHFHGAELEQTALINDQRLDKLADDLNQLAASTTVLVLSPTPMFGFSRIEAIQLGMASMSTTVDREAWITDEAALEKLQASLMQLQGLKHAMIMSGDVHYAFSRLQRLDHNGREVKCWQLCASASCNTPMGSHIGLQLLRQLPDCFFKERTPYLRTDKGDVLSSDKNVGLLSLDAYLEPEQAWLLCRDKQGRKYQKRYDLKQPQEVLI